MPVCKEPFGVTRDGRPVDKFTLRRGALEAEILTYGAALRALRVPDRDGKPVDVVLGYDTVESYETNGGYVGAVVGATYPEMGKVLRKIMPKTYILVPGYGAQGGKGADLVHFFDEDGLGAIVNSSRGIIAAWKQESYQKFGVEHFGEASRAAVLEMIQDISGALQNRS